MIWPKRGGGVASDLTQQIVRDAGLAIGLVDYKVCSIEATWTGLLFARRKTSSSPIASERRQLRKGADDHGSRVLSVAIRALFGLMRVR